MAEEADEACSLRLIHQTTCCGDLRNPTYSEPVFRTYVLKQQKSRNDMEGPSRRCKSSPKMRSNQVGDRSFERR